MSRPTKTIWVTHDGRRIRVKNMTTSHLSNTIAMLRRTAERERQAELQAAYACLAMLRGEMATFYCEQDIKRLEDADVDDWLLARVPCFEEMLKEIGERGVDVGS